MSLDGVLGGAITKDAMKVGAHSTSSRLTRDRRLLFHNVGIQALERL